MPELPAEANQVITAVRALQTVDESTVDALSQLLSNRLDKELVQTLLSSNSKTVVSALFQVAQKASSANLQGFVLCFLADLVFLSHTLAKELSEGSSSDNATLLLRLVMQSKGDVGITNPAMYLAAVIMRHGGPVSGLTHPLELFFQVVHNVLDQKVLQVPNVEFVVRACAQLARRKDMRAFLLKEGVLLQTPRLLTEMVSSSTSSMLQLIYDTLVLTWLLSYEYEGTVQLQKARMIPQLLRVLQRMQKEKCIRLALMILMNLVENEQRFLHVLLAPGLGDWVDENIYVLSQLRQEPNRKGSVLMAEMVGVGLQKTLMALKRRKFGDEDILALVEGLSSKLEESMETITSFTEYRGEVFSEALDWTPVHTSSKFWRENCLSMELNNFEVLNALGKIILETKDDRTLAVACHDLGETVRYHPTGRSLLLLPTMKGVKERIINLMFDKRAEVAKEALLCTQKIMVQQWEYIPPQ